LALVVGTIAWFAIVRVQRDAEERQARTIGAKLPALPLEELLGKPPAHTGRRSWVWGRYDRDRTQLWKTERDRQPGARVVTPLFVDPEEEWALLVDRGWIPSEESEGFRERDGAAAARVLYGTLEPLTDSLEALRERFPYPILGFVFVREPGNGDELPVPDAVDNQWAAHSGR